MKAIVDERIDMRAGDVKHRSAVAAIAAARSAARHPFLTAEREAAASSAAGLDVNVYFVDKHNRTGAARASSWLGARVSRTYPSLRWQDADHAAVRAVILKPDPAGDPGENRIV